MRALRRLLNRLFASASRQRDEARLSEELDAHLQMQTAENVRAGASPEEARRQAVLKFGPIEAIKDDYRDQQRLPLLEDVLQDVRYTFRQLRNSPAFTLTAAVSLAWASVPTPPCFRSSSGPCSDRSRFRSHTSSST